MMELVDKSMKITTINTSHMFKELEEIMNMTRREMEDDLKDPSQISTVE